MTKCGPIDAMAVAVLAEVPDEQRTNILNRLRLLVLPGF
jgi:hypothetical protein